MSSSAAAPDSTTPSSSSNQDELTLAQKDTLAKEIADSTPLVGDLEALAALERDFASDDSFLTKVGHMGEDYDGMRRTRPDGNCFYRAFLMSVCERASEDQEFRSRFKEMVEPTKGEERCEG